MTPRWQLLLTTAALPLAGCSDQARRAPGAADDSGRNPVVAQAAAGVDSARTPTVTRGWVVSFDGVGPLRIGMTKEEARAAVRAGLDWPAGPDEGCDYVFVHGIDQRLGLMISNGRIARVDVRTPLIPTAAGARVGDMQARIQQLYGSGVQVEPHKYEDGHYLIVSAPGDTARRLIFETRRDTVTMFRAGKRPEVEWVEGCS